MIEKSWKEQRLAKRRFWEAHIQTWEKSGLSQNEYCRRSNIKKSQFTYWKIKIFKERFSPGGQLTFVPVAQPPQSVQETHDETGITVHLGKAKIQLSTNFDTTSFVKIVSLLEKGL